MYRTILYWPVPLGGRCVRLVQTDQCMTSKYRESDKRADGSWCFRIALAVLWCHTLIILHSAASSRTHLLIRRKNNHHPANRNTALQVIPPTRHTASSVCCHQGGDCGVSRRGPADWRTASYIRLSGSWTPSRPCPPPPPLLPHATLNSDTTTPPHLPTSPHPQDPPPYKLWPAPVTLCSTGLISTSSSIDCKLPLLTVW